MYFNTTQLPIGPWTMFNASAPFFFLAISLSLSLDYFPSYPFLYCPSSPVPCSVCHLDKHVVTVNTHRQITHYRNNKHAMRKRKRKNENEKEKGKEKKKGRDGGMDELENERERD
ncbi:hypothetical protein BCR41DRAFT_240377 [Lobosporangium transversale]|uniref:Uncharacterized protein n=1 Tax=Lobosporangium transversale TaxID=64571 RepID=A0A1Y2G5I9_9FUNG|nr:hypothetical protein BCR41DRAFT_240377 [Lobosporangium transversale]ORY95203.1 hypothetical protein BCR41DRAFT_240377 [Lobosporangium transversale]|eukprot:XP_021875403.1 hypothetical protein BCR41DRAFT_240377 [Lobosporangium transversale]